MRLLAPGVWTETLTIPVSSMPTLEYFRLEVPEDAAGVKLMVDQLEGKRPLLQSAIPPPANFGWASKIPQHLAYVDNNRDKCAAACNV